jgi:hypothetical protein
MNILLHTRFITSIVGALWMAAMISGCSSANGIMRSYPAAEDFNVASMAHAKKINVPLWAGTTASSPELIAEVWCVSDSTSDKDPKPKGCRYITLIESADKDNSTNSVTAFFKACDDEATSPPMCRTARNRLHSYLMKIAKKNCSTYLQDVFTVKTTADGTSGFLKDMLSGGAVTAAASGSPPVAGGLALANLLVGSYDKVNHSMFMGETAPVLVLAIEAAQETYRLNNNLVCAESTLDNGTSYGKCDVHKVFSYIQGYSDQCSLKAGIAILNAAIGVKNVAEESKKAKEVANEAKTIADTAAANAKTAAQNSADALKAVDATKIQASLKEVDVIQKKTDGKIAEIEATLKTILQNPPAPQTK